MNGPHTVHASCVAYDGKAALFLGASGSGKSALALRMMALGCDLVADDRVVLTAQEGALVATCPETIAGLIEARGIGILNAANVPNAVVQVVVDMDMQEQDRLPETRYVTLCDLRTPLIHRGVGDHFGPAIVQLLKAGWSNR
ncbi:serine kinase [Loktanella sp. D2R18]|uniref:HPr kinase/phosphorylase n=1 Tax=Rhodobacterales TaxID=204455 RepID=UPI000DE8753D|nr:MULTISPECIES: HPr kinase/phosphatase C-terminal domain-containing protein [Rhodobacterales]MDO6591338.1 HPr kinase/phosphatase C-terminal domain-containing protein [Yoonia sp. 1_MG-2023]RBW46287.1 serine kinase [Loktanella sp. D2R18]